MANQTIERVDARSVLLAAANRSHEIPESAHAYGWQLRAGKSRG